MAIAVKAPGDTGLYLNYTSFAKNIEVPAYEAMEFIPTLDPTDRPYSSHKIRIWDELSTTTVTSTDHLDDSSITFSDGTPSVVTMTPGAVYIAVGFSKQQQDYVEVALDPGMRQNIISALAGGCDALVTAQISSLTNGIGDAVYVPTAADIRKLVARLRIASPAVKVGQDTIHACLHPGAIDGLLNIADFMNAEVRGDAENPQVRGIFTKASGVLWRFTTKVPTANGNGGEGAMYVPSCFGVGWNTKPMLTKDTSGLATLHYGYACVGGCIKFNDRGQYLRTVVTV